MISRQRHDGKITRRRVMAAGGATLLAAGLGRFGAAAASAPQADGKWTFTDDRGVTVTLPERPRRVIADVAVAAALWDFNLRPVGIFGWNITGKDTFNAAGGNVDPKAVTFLNGPDTTLDVERAAAIKPDLIASLVFAEKYGVWSIDPKEQSRIEQIAPIVAISGIERADRSLARSAELARALGADLQAPEIVKQRTAYEAASKRLTALTEQKPGLSAIFGGVWEDDKFYVANPDAAADIMLFRDLGLSVPKVSAPKEEYWEALSAEQALKYPTDMLFYSVRSELTSLEEFRKHPTLKRHPAVMAGQVYGWNQDIILSYAGMAATLTATGDGVERSKPVVAS